MTGYFAHIKRPTRRTKIHIVLSNGQPACNCKPAEGSEFQWCAHGAYLGYLDCQNCLRVYRKTLAGGSS